jgi:hypothetical protein
VSLTVVSLPGLLCRKPMTRIAVIGNAGTVLEAT